MIIGINEKNTSQGRTTGESDARHFNYTPHWMAAFSALLLAMACFHLEAKAERVENETSAKITVQDSGVQAERVFAELKRAARGDSDANQKVDSLHSTYRQLDGSAAGIESFLGVLQRARPAMTQGLQGESRVQMQQHLIRLQTQVDYRRKVLQPQEEQHSKSSDIAYTTHVEEGEPA